MKPLSIGLIEFTRSNILYDNIRRVASLLRRIDSVDIVFLPENWLTPKPLPEDYYFLILKKIIDKKLIIFTGISYIIDHNRVLSRGYIIERGDIIPICEKIFPSKAVGERGRISPGSFYGPISVQGTRIGCIGCVDIFYPEIARAHTVRGAEILYNPAAIPSNRITLWHSMLSARAAENIVFAIGVNSVGSLYPDSRFTGGGSIVVAPDGSPVTPTKINKNIKIYEIDLSIISLMANRWAYREDLVKERVSRAVKALGKIDILSSDSASTLVANNEGARKRL